MKKTIQFEENLDTFYQPINCQDKLLNRISANHVAAVITAFKRQRVIIARNLLVCVENGRIRRRISKIFCALESQIFSMFIYFWKLNN